MIEEASPVCADYALYTTKDMMCMEDEVLGLLRAFVRATKPRVVVELGAYTGDTAQHIGLTLHANTVGKLITYEIDPRLAQQAEARCLGLPVEVVADDYANHLGQIKDIDLLIVDGDNSTGARYRDFRLWFPYVKQRGFVWIHDALKGPDEYKETKEDSGSARILLWTPRGVSIVQKGNF